MDLTDARDQFLRAKRREGLSPRTLEGYRKTLTKFLAETEAAATDDLDRQAIERWIDDRMDDGMKPVTLAHYCREVKVWCRWLHEEGLAGVNAFAGVKMRKVTPDLHTLISEASFEKMLAACPKATAGGRRDRAILCFLYDTGVRVGELVTLKAEDVDLDAGQAKVRGKGAKERIVFFGDETALALQRYRMRLETRVRPEMFFVTDTWQPMRPNTVNLLLARVAGRSGVGKPFNPHAFRHTFATNYLRAGGDLHSLQRLLGHADLQIVTRYLSLVTEDLAAKHKQFSPMARLRSS